MPKVVGVRFHGVGKIYHFAPGTETEQRGDLVIVETAQGEEFGVVAEIINDMPEEKLVAPLKPILRLATPEDETVYNENLALEKVAFRECREKITAHALDMHLVDVECSFDRNKLVFYFTADGRIDFRNLVRDLAQAFRVRIELRQIGVRDEARMVGGLGICGRTLCCASFLHDFIPVSIKMAKEQNISMNPGKISGSCGRLLCCLKYEQEVYEYAHKLLPNIGEIADLPNGRYKVESVDLLREKVILRSVQDVELSMEMSAVEYAKIMGRELPPVDCCAKKHGESNCQTDEAEEETADSENSGRKHRATGGKGHGCGGCCAGKRQNLSIKAAEDNEDCITPPLTELLHNVGTDNQLDFPRDMRVRKTETSREEEENTMPEWLDAAIIMEDEEDRAAGKDRRGGHRGKRRRGKSGRNNENNKNSNT